MHLIDMCKLNLAKCGVSGAHLTDLSKAFDWLSYKLVISKLQAYSFDVLVAYYFTSRQQRVKVGIARSSGSYLSKGAPRGSYCVPFIYNMLSNDLFYLIADQFDILAMMIIILFVAIAAMWWCNH